MKYPRITCAILKSRAPSQKSILLGIALTLPLIGNLNAQSTPPPTSGNGSFQSPYYVSSKISVTLDAPNGIDSYWYANGQLLWEFGVPVQGNGITVDTSGQYYSMPVAGGSTSNVFDVTILGAPAMPWWGYLSLPILLGLFARWFITRKAFVLGTR